MAVLTFIEYTSRTAMSLNHRRRRRDRLCGSVRARLLFPRKKRMIINEASNAHIRTTFATANVDLLALNVNRLVASRTIVESNTTPEEHDLNQSST